MRKLFKKKTTLYIAGGLTGVFIVLFFTVFAPLLSVYGQVNGLRATAKKAFNAAKQQDLIGLDKEVKTLRKEVQVAKRNLQPLFVYQKTPFIGFMFSDLKNGIDAGEYLLLAGEKVIKAIEPYADLIGFKKGSEFSNQPTEKRLETAILTIDKLVPQIDSIAADLEKAQVLLAKIDPKRYPEKLGPYAVRGRVENIHGQVLGLVSLATDAKPLFKRLPYLLGKDAERKYLVLFVNDAELRPTGGFITAYSIFSVEKGTIRAKESGDIYDLDNQISAPPAPEEITRYHRGVTRFYLRDSNLSPDYVESIKLFEGLLKKGNKRLDYDGVITLDTQVLVNTLRILGPTEAAGMMFTADPEKRCNGCPQAIYALEDAISRPTPYLRERRKGLLSALLFNLMQKSLGVSPSQYWGRLMQMLLVQLDEKHALINLKDKESQKAMESLNYAGRIVESGGDYLHINNTNYAGAKSNLFVKSSIESKTTKEGGKLVRELTLEYRNTFAASDCNLEHGKLCLNAPMPNWVRIYVPEGAQLIKFTGSEKKVRTYEALGKQVFEGYFILNPLGKVIIKVAYEVPSTVLSKNKYELLIQKQPGTTETATTVWYGSQQQQTDLRKDTKLSF